ncbi:MAG: hypothetical protein Q8908_16455 [Bacteroidota bacterium]|nr:hypothetical protein [Bacteroidota bacterium]
METSNMEIKLLEGLDDIDFGATTEEVAEKFGKPDETEELDEGDDELETVIWTYNDKGVTLFFDGDDPKLFSCVETDNKNTTLFGRKIFAMTSQEIIDMMTAHGFEEVDEDIEDWGEKRLSFDEALIDFYFEKDEMVTVNWGVFFEEFDESDLEQDTKESKKK